MIFLIYKYIPIREKISTSQFSQQIVDISGVVGRERMGTAFPHKKLSGNGVPTREILRYLLIVAIKLAIFHCYHNNVQVQIPTCSIPCISILEIKLCQNMTSGSAKY